MHIEHINICAPIDLLEKEKTFFCELFDLAVGFRPKFFRGGYWLYHQDKPMIHLTESADDKASQQTGFLDHIAFQLTGLGDFIHRLTQLDIPYTTDSLAEIGMTQLFFTSPAGIGLEANFVHESLPDIC